MMQELPNPEGDEIRRLDGPIGFGFLRLPNGRLMIQVLVGNAPLWQFVLSAEWEERLRRELDGGPSLVAATPGDVARLAH